MMTMAELRRQLSDIEPDESTYANIGPDDVPNLEALLHDEEAWMAARAVFALARIDTPEARTALIQAGASPREEVRVATASAAQLLPPVSSDIVLERLLDDPDVGVRKFAIQSVSERNSAPVRARLHEMATAESDPALRALAGEQASTLEP
jgi:HEAT repeat protein